MDILLWLAAGHFLGDFAFQSAWMSEGKRTSWEINAYHAATYAATMFIISAIGGLYLSPFLTGLFFVSHFFIDPLKARWGIIKHIWLDQILHFAVIFFVIFLLK